MGITFQDKGDNDGFEGNISYGPAYVQFGETNDQSAFTLGYTLNIGPKTLMWFELYRQEAGADEVDDNVTAIATLTTFCLIMYPALKDDTAPIHLMQR